MGRGLARPTSEASLPARLVENAIGFCIVPAHGTLWQPSHRAMGFNRRKMEDQRREVAEKEAATRRATNAQVLEDAERLIAAWNERANKKSL
jgi:hypothetical protein